ncbi:hypothetical protein GGI07_003763 [Coemansia sp. Benny D115]|nr:hypothetical protein GGI07_003763 [Coemansia sp. Benny D115]
MAVISNQSEKVGTRKSTSEATSAAVATKRRKVQAAEAPPAEAETKKTVAAAAAAAASAKKSAPSAKTATHPKAKAATKPAALKKAESAKTKAEPATAKPIRKSASTAAAETKTAVSASKAMPVGPEVPKHLEPRPFIKARVAPVHPLAKRATASGTVYVFGNGDCGQLGLGEDMVERKKPFPVTVLDAQNVVDIVSGGLHTMALTSAGKLWSWGCNDQKALGRGGDEFVPGPVDALANVSIVRVACSDSATFALSEDGHVYSWGTFRSAEGIMGFSEGTYIQETPMVINEFREPIVDLCAGVDHALALSASGKVYAWGYGQQGQLGRLIMERRRLHGLTPERLNLQDVYHIGSGSYHSFAVTKDGSVYAWGLNNFHQLGLSKADGGDQEFIYKPTPIAALKDVKIKKVSGGEHYSIALTEDGNLYSFGRSDSHQTGLPFATLVQDTEKLQLNSNSQEPSESSSSHKKAITVPTHIESISSVSDFVCGTNHTLALVSDGNVYTWGYGEMLQLGNGEEEDVAQPLLLKGQKIEGKRISKVAAGGQHSVILAA